MLINYLITTHYENGMKTEEEAKHIRKVINAVVKKLMKEERMIMIVEDSPDLKMKLLKLHPNYIP